MFKHWRKAFLVLALVPTAAWAESPFSGKWKTDLGASQLPSKPVTFMIKDGLFSCSTCVPAFKVKADGVAHPVAGSPYFDAAMIKVVDAHTISNVRLKKGVTTAKVTNTVSADGKTMTGKFEDLTVPATPVTGVETFTRVEPAPAGAHPISGSWRENKIADMSSNSLVTEVNVVGDTVHYSTQTGQSFVAKIGGPPAPFKGDPGITAVTIKAPDARTMVETDYRDGKVVSIETITLSPDGKAIKVEVQDKLHDTTAHFTALKD